MAHLTKEVDMEAENSELVQAGEDEPMQGEDLAEAGVEATVMDEEESVSEGVTEASEVMEYEAVEQAVPAEPQTFDLNTAAAEELQTISGIGPELAGRILDYRERTGGFLSKDELLAVSGIGPVLYDRIADQLSVVPPEGALEQEAPVEEAVPTEIAGLAEELAAEPEIAPEGIGAQAAPTREPEARDRWAWVWPALLGALLGVTCTLLILFSLNGSLTLSQTPVILDINNRLDGLTTGVDDLQAEIADVQQRLKVLEGLPTRMDAVEETVGELGQTVDRLDQALDDLSGRTQALDERVDVVEEDVGSLQESAEKVDSFFQQLQSLLADVFGSAPGASE
jgi:competence ComEA-like helix-hairpin-helix protein